MAEKYLLYTSLGVDASDHAPRKQYWSGPVFDEKKYSFKPAKLPEEPPVPSKPVELNYNCRECGATSFAPIEFCDTCLEAAELTNYCRECGAFSFVEIDYCDSCRKPRKKRSKHKKAKPRKPQVQTLPKKGLIELEKRKLENLSLGDLEEKKKLLVRAQRLCADTRFSIDGESPEEKASRERLHKIYIAYFNDLSELVLYNIARFLESPRPNFYNSRRAPWRENQKIES